MHRLTRLARSVKGSLTYSNVMATAAVFIALGGTSYAALGRNSVGDRQIRSKAVGNSELKSRAVTSSKIRAGSVTASRLSRGALTALRGATGPQGPGGPVGPVGPSGVTYRALINSGGGPVGGNTSGASSHLETGIYRFGFDRSIAGCALTATLSRVPGGSTVDPPAGRITTAEENGRVLVQTFDAGGNPADVPFHFIAAC